ncbi:glutathione S-transferase C-terminal domain-containing protein [uncultured Tateyamaria sp.]|uniref:glutathione S-transferase C-terminal domain-containing protein n=1 Tax=uncultured Tateyamaria sp. TaxID=455651 RepID=UPI002639725C|nr:glutathione S-transferase C-terminal domain-containing protein [uncultured Tateyamaria sp.]
MGMLIDGIWRHEIDRYMRDGAFEREASTLPDHAVCDIAARLRDNTRLALIVSQSCPWSHRTTLVRALRGLHEVEVVVAGGPRVEGYAVRGFNETAPGDAPIRHVHQLYSATDPAFTGRATVPLLWDVQARTILSNSSATIARGLDRVGGDWRLAPDPMASDIDALNAQIYEGLANAVYRAGFATEQDAHAKAVRDVFATLDWLETLLADRRCLFGHQITEADLFLFATLIRFDSVYASLFRCTRRRLVDYPVLWAYARDVFAWPGIAGTFDFDANLRGYFQNDGDNNPHGIVPELPDLDWTKPHGRDPLGSLMVWQNGTLVSLEDVSCGDHAT